MSKSYEIVIFHDWIIVFNDEIVLFHDGIIVFDDVSFDFLYILW